MFRIAILTFLLLISFNLSAQINCEINFVGPVDQCNGVPLRNAYAGDFSARVAFEPRFNTPQGPYDIQVNGITFENEYLWSLSLIHI